MFRCVQYTIPAARTDDILLLVLPLPFWPCLTFHTVTALHEDDACFEALKRRRTTQNVMQRMATRKTCAKNICYQSLKERKMSPVHLDIVAIYTEDQLATEMYLRLFGVSYWFLSISDTASPVLYLQADVNIWVQRASTFYDMLRLPVEWPLTHCVTVQCSNRYDFMFHCGCCNWTGSRESSCHFRTNEYKPMRTSTGSVDGAPVAGVNIVEMLIPSSRSQRASDARRPLIGWPRMTQTLIVTVLFWRSFTVEKDIRKSSIFCSHRSAKKFIEVVEVRIVPRWSSACTLDHLPNYY